MGKNFWKGKRVLVTGGASFIGSHLTDRLVELGAVVRVADDLSSGRLENLNQSVDDIEFIQGDLREAPFAAKVCHGTEVLFHLAAAHGGRGYIDTHPVECAANMLLDTTVFKHAFQAGVDRICFTSSACVYPTHLQDAPDTDKLVYLREEWANTYEQGKASPDGEYGWAKLMGELTLRAYHKQHKLKSVSCRLFTAYGERENETHAVIAFIAKAFAQLDPYPIWGDGTQDRNFTYVSDIVNGMVLAAENITDGSAINVGTAEHIRVKDAVEKVFGIMKWRPNRIEYDTTKPVGVFSRAADLTLLRKSVGWVPEVSFEQGLERTISWYVQSRTREEVSSNLQTLLMERSDGNSPTDHARAQRSRQH
jgi:nucleoside-diphosphate-sugar epimerase